MHHFLRRDYGTFQLFSGNKGDKLIEGLEERSYAYVDDIYRVQGMYIVPFLLIIASISCCNDLMNLLVRRSSAKPSSGKTPEKNRKKKGKGGEIGPNDADNLSNTVVDVNTVSSTDVLISSTELAYVFPLLLPITLVFYLTVFHSLSNLPLTDKLLYGIHQRFWMQPNVITFIIAGVGYSACFALIQKLLGFTSETAEGGSSKGGRGEGNGIATISVLKCIGASAIALLQYRSNVFVSDHSTSIYFNNYARALLEPLPMNAVLLINYDQQWTSIRYLQNCEGVRQDVTTINLSMMSYEWFQYKQKYITNHHKHKLKFPGHRLVSLLY